MKRVLQITNAFTYFLLLLLLLILNDDDDDDDGIVITSNKAISIDNLKVIIHNINITYLDMI